MEQKRIAIFASGSGSNCENLIRYFKDSEMVECALVVSNKADAYVLERAQRLGVPTAVMPKAVSAQRMKRSKVMGVGPLSEPLAARGAMVVFLLLSSIFLSFP